MTYIMLGSYGKTYSLISDVGYRSPELILPILKIKGYLEMIFSTWESKALRQLKMSPSKVLVLLLGGAENTMEVPFSQESIPKLAVE